MLAIFVIQREEFVAGKAVDMKSSTAIAFSDAVYEGEDFPPSRPGTVDWFDGHVYLWKAVPKDSTAFAPFPLTLRPA